MLIICCKTLSIVYRQCFTSCYRHFTIYNGLHHIINILQSTMFYIILSTFYNRQCFTTYYQHFTIDNVLIEILGKNTSQYRLSSKQNVGNVTSLLHENIEKEMLTIQKKC
jgi:hypothetical protein